jgi:hypothetical protein
MNSINNILDTVIVRRADSDIQVAYQNVEVWKALVWRREKALLGLTVVDKIETAFRRALVTSTILTPGEKPHEGNPQFEEGWIYSFLQITGKPEDLLEEVRGMVDLKDGEVLLLMRGRIPAKEQYYLDSTVMDIGFMKIVSKRAELQTHTWLISEEDSDKREKIQGAIQKLK